MSSSKPHGEVVTPPELALPSVTWSASSIDDTVAQLGTDLGRGLTTAEGAARLVQFGPNVPTVFRRKPWWKKAAEPLTEPLIPLLLAVAVLYAVLGQPADALTIAVVIFAVMAVEIHGEGRARRAIGALRTLSTPLATVIRDGQVRELATVEVVPGDLVVLQPGMRAPADLRLIESVALRVDESSLTGEAAPVTKQADLLLPADTELADRRNLAYAGTLVTAGKARGIVVTTGPATELGRIAALAQRARVQRTPLQLQMRRLAGSLLWVAIGFSVLVPVLGVLVAGRPFKEMLLTGLTLAFATIPEELPILITMVLAVGAYELAKQQAIVKRLQAAETLGSVSVVGADKTGTLTEHRLRVVELFADGGASPVVGTSDATALRLLEIGVLVNDADVQRSAGRSVFTGDPTETALLAAAEEAGLDVAQVRRAALVLEEYPFDDRRQRMAVVYRRDAARWLVAKGAPEALLALCTRVQRAGGAQSLDPAGRQALQDTAEAMAARGLRVLAFVERPLGSDGDGNPADLEEQLTLVGLAGLEDPPRPEAPGAIAQLRAAGVRVLMLTGDHPATAQAIAARVGIDPSHVVRGRELDGLNDVDLGQLVTTASIFARITPEHKLRLVRALQARGEVVAVTGDGVNDAPALRKAAVGVAMGQSGSDVAREAADLILADDNFATVAVAVGAGRMLYANLRKAVRYYLAAKIALIASSLAPVLMHLAVPFAPVQIILMELFMDLGATTAFVAERPEGDLMARPPRDSRQPFLDRAMLAGMAGGGLSLAAAVLISYVWVVGHGRSLAAAQTAAFAAWMIGHVVLAAHMRAERQPLLRTHLLANRPFLVWIGAVIVVLSLSMALPPLQARLHLAPLSRQDWLVVIAAAVLVPSWWEPLKWARRAFRPAVRPPARG